MPRTVSSPRMSACLALLALFHLGTPSNQVYQPRGHPYPSLELQNARLLYHLYPRVNVPFTFTQLSTKGLKFRK